MAVTHTRKHFSQDDRVLTRLYPHTCPCSRRVRTAPSPVCWALCFILMDFQTAADPQKNGQKVESIRCFPAAPLGVADPCPVGACHRLCVHRMLLTEVRCLHQGYCLCCTCPLGFSRCRTCAHHDGFTHMSSPPCAPPADPGSCLQLPALYHSLQSLL